MSDIKFEELKRKDRLYFTRMMPKLGYYEIHEVSVATHHVGEDNYCTVSDINTKQSFLLHKPRAEQTLFIDRQKALEYLKEQKALNGNGVDYKNIK